MDDVIVVGAGWAGLTAAALAVERGARVRLIAQGIGSPIVTPGWISVWDSARGDLLSAVEGLVARVPEHPYALAGVEALLEAAAFFRDLSARIGLPYTGDLGRNRSLPTALGTFQHPALVPPGYAVDADATPLLVGFEGWRDYYPALSGSKSALITLPLEPHPWDLTPTALAQAFDQPAVRAEVAKRVAPHLNGATSVGFPAVLGLEDPASVLGDLQGRLGVPVFEIPTLPPSVPGTRLFNRVRRYLLDHRVRVQVGHPVARGIVEGGRAVGVEVAAAGKPQPFRAGAIILATGGLYGGGLFSDDRGRVWEPVFGLPVRYEPDRARWFNDSLLAPGGHPAARFGVRANSQMQPIRADGEDSAPLIEGLYVAGHILAHPQGMDVPDPLETAEGVALATAYRAVMCALGAG